MRGRRSCLLHRRRPGGRRRRCCIAAAPVYHESAAASPGPAAFPPALPSGLAPQLRRTVLAGVSALKAPHRLEEGQQMAEHNGLDGKLMSVGEAVERFVPTAADRRRRLHDHAQPDGGGLRDRPPPHQGPASRGAQQRPGAGRARRRRLRAPPRHRLRRQRPLRPTCIRFRKAVERGELLVEDYTNNMMSLRFLAGALGVPRPQQVGARHRRDRPRGFPPELRGNEGVPSHKVIVIDDPFGHVDDEVVLLPRSPRTSRSSTPSR